MFRILRLLEGQTLEMKPVEHLVYLAFNRANDALTILLSLVAPRRRRVSMQFTEKLGMHIIAWTELICRITWYKLESEIDEWQF